MQVATRAEAGSEPRIPLSRERVLQAAVKVADEGGIDQCEPRLAVFWKIRRCSRSELFHVGFVRLK